MKSITRMIAGAVLVTAWPLGAAMMPSAANAFDGGADQVSHQHAYVAMVTNKGEFDAPAATMLATVDAALARWVDEGDGALSFDRVGDMIQYQSDQACPDRGPFRDEAKAKFQAKYPGLKFGGSSGNHVVVLVPVACIGNSGGTMGSSLTNSGSGVAYSYTTAKGTQSLLHELGHNFGLEHSPSVPCDACDRDEYGDQYEIMGRTVSKTPASFGSYERELLGLGDGSDLQTVQLASGSASLTKTVDLLSRGTETGIRGVKVVDPTDGSTYYLNFRNGSGDDASSFYANQAQPAKGEYWNKGVTVQALGQNDDGDEVAVLQGYATAGSSVWRHGWNTGQVFERGGVKVEVLQTQLTGSETDTARVRITVTNPSVAAAPAGPVTLLSKTGLSGASDSQTFFSADVPAGVKSLTFRTSGGSGDVDLYTRFNAKPTTSSYSCAPYLDGNEETCTVSSPSAGTWQVMLNGWDDYAGVTLSVSYTK